MPRQSSPRAHVNPDGARRLPLLQWIVVLLACVVFVEPALSQTNPSLTIEGQGSATKAGAGQFSAKLPDGTECTATFSGGKISVFGHSATKAKATCTNGATVQTVPVVIYRRLNGSPKEATLTFRDGTKVLVLIPPPADVKPAP